MRIHKVTCKEQLGYPVGIYIDTAIVFINSVFEKIKNLKSFPKDDIAIWCRGSSGAILAGLLSGKMIENGTKNISINHVKKDGESSHSYRYEFFKNNIIIDDLISSGETINSIMLEMARSRIKYCDYLIVYTQSVKYEKILSLKCPSPKTLITAKIDKGYIKYLKLLKPSNLPQYDFTEKTG